MATPKASLTTSQGVSAIIAGIIGHLLFSLAWFSLVVGVVGLVAKGLIFAAIDNLVSQIELTGSAGDSVVSLIETIRDVLNTLSLVLIISAGVTIVIAFLISGGIMKGGRVRKPWGTTLSAMLIVGVLDLGLFWVYLFIGLSASDETGFLPTYPIASIIGTIVIGALVWLWMAHIRRAPLSELEAAPAVAAEAAPVTAPDVPVDTATAPAVPAVPAVADADPAPTAVVAPPTTQKSTTES